MKRIFFPSAALALAALLPGAALRGQNSVPNSPPSILPHRSAFQPANADAPAGGNPAQTAVSAAAASAGPAPAAGGSGPAGPSSPVATTVSGDYILAAADTLEMSIFNEPSLTTQTRVAADGTVQFPLIGELKVGGMPIREAREVIRRKYNADYLVEPQVYLNVIAYAQRQFTVLGQVNRPGTFDFPNGGEHLGLLQAIGLAGGFTRLANESEVLLKRTGPRGDQNLKINVKKLNSPGVKPFEVLSGDVITVKESWY